MTGNMPEFKKCNRKRRKKRRRKEEEEEPIKNEKLRATKTGTEIE
jgi:hypothetical protein